MLIILIESDSNAVSAQLPIKRSCQLLQCMRQLRYVFTSRIGAVEKFDLASDASLFATAQTSVICVDAFGAKMHTANEVM